jgi:hypothetical protein
VDLLIAVDKIAIPDAHDLTIPDRDHNRLQDCGKNPNSGGAHRETGTPVQYRMVKLFARMQPPLNNWKLMTCVNYPYRTESKCM